MQQMQKEQLEKIESYSSKKPQTAEEIGEGSAESSQGINGKEVQQYSNKEQEENKSKEEEEEKHFI